MVNQNTEPEPSSSSGTLAGTLTAEAHPDDSSELAAADDDDDEITEKALKVIAKRRMANSTQQITNRAGWLKATITGLWTEYEDQLNRIDTRQFTVEQLVRWLEPPANGRTSHPVERTAAADRARLADSDARAANPCPKCDGNRRLEATGQLCDRCNGTGIKS